MGQAGAGRQHRSGYLGSLRTIRESVDSLSALTIQAVREIPEVKRVHVMAYRQEESVAQIVEQAGLLPRPKKKRRFMDLMLRVTSQT